jgi:5-methylcytosine-specific restriction endonuclease McrA
MKAANPEKYREIDRRSVKKRRAEEPEKHRAIGRASHLRYLERLRNEEPDKYRERWERDTATRRARKARVPREPYKRAEIFARWDNTCCYCPAPAEHLDHVHPISKGGADAAHNLVPACAPCNLTKSNKSLADWASTF